MWGNPYIGIYSYNGITTNGYYTLVIRQYWGTQLYAENWRITASLTEDIISTDGTKVFPSDKIGLILVSTGGQPSTIPDVSEIELSYPVMLNGTQEIDLVNGTNVPLSNQVGNYYVYYQFELNFQLAAIGGGYLDVLDDDTGSTTITYSAPFEFKAYINGNEYTLQHTNNVLQVQKLSTNTSYSILVDPVNVELDFETVADYMYGLNVTYNNAVAVTSTIDYHLRMSSIYPTFTSPSGDLLPLDVVQLQLTGDASSSPMALSDAMMTLVSGTSTGGNTRTYNMVFTTGADDSRLFNLTSQQYSTDLLFEIIPQ